MIKKAITLIAGIALFATVMAGCSSQTIEEPDMATVGATPWSDYEKTTYGIYQGAEQAGSAEFVIEKSADGATFDISKTKTIGADEVKSGAVVRSDSLAPVSSYYYAEEGETKTTYGREWQLEVSTAKEKDITVDLPENCFDNESLLTIIRAFELDGSKTFKINDAIPRTVKIEPLSISPKGQEKVSVPYGDVDCDVVKLGDQTLWYSKDANRLLVQYQNGDTLYKLDTVETARP